MAKTDLLVFIDTNVLLDLYRGRGSPDGPTVLQLINAHHDRLITGEQIEMEFKKNRQRVILESLRLDGTPKGEKPQIPSFLQEAQAAKAIDKSIKDIQKQARRIKERLGRVLKNPSAHDPVYKCLQRLWKADGPYHLTRSKKIRLQVRRRAWKRFMLGYPPRKREDLAIGDAINWEWVVQCAQDSAKGVVIVSRDSDYGVTLHKEPVLNDWLLHEFKERTSRKRKIILTDRLTHGFEEASIKVTKQAKDEEDQILADRAADRVAGIHLPPVEAAVKHPYFGAGTVHSVVEAGEDSRVVVDFAQYGRKQFLLKHARLEFP